MKPASLFMQTFEPQFFIHHSLFVPMTHDQVKDLKGRAEALRRYL
jgi:hypothetical protein